MLTILGKTTSINVRKILWTCEEAELHISRKITAADLPRQTTPSAPEPQRHGAGADRRRFLCCGNQFNLPLRCAKPGAMTCCHRSRRPALTSSAGWTGKPNSTTRGAMSFRRWAAKTGL